MLDDKPNGIGQIQFIYRQYGNDAQIPWIVEYFDGSSWVGLGTITGTATEQTALYTVNVSTATKIRFRSGTNANFTASSNGKRINIDELSISDYNVNLGVSDIKNVSSQFVKNTIVNNEINFSNKAEVKLYNMNGQVVKSASVSANKNLEVSDLEPGMYIASVS